MIALRKFIVALALLVAVVAIVAQAEPDAGKVCKEEVPSTESNDACKACCNKNGFLYGAFGGFIHQTCGCVTYAPEDPELKAPGLARIFGAALTRH